MRILQFELGGQVRVGRVLDQDTIEIIASEAGVYGLAQQAIEEGIALAALVERCATGQHLAYQPLVDERRLLPPIIHPDPAHLLVSGTGLTHLGSAASRDAMHAELGRDPAPSDSMKIFMLGVEGGKPEAGAVGTQPEWFYKGDGSIVVAPEADLPMPGFAQDGGEEPELVGVYLIDREGVPHRVGFAVGNEFSDHVTERFNYLWLAHSKLRSCAFGPELLLGEPPADLQGTSRIVRDGATLWEQPFSTGEANMSHTLGNLEHHHFKYAQFRRPGDVHVHFFGTATLSFSDQVQTRDGDRFEISLQGFGRPLRNRICRETDHGLLRVRQL